MELTSKVLGAACALSWVLFGLGTSLKVLTTLSVVYIGYYWRWFYIAARTAKRDFTALFYYKKILSVSQKYTGSDSAISDIFHTTVLKHPNKSCFIMDDEVLTFQQVEEFSLRVSVVLREQGVKKGDIVGMMMSNCPEFPATWLGISRLGAVTSLININQTGLSLLHSINVAKCNVIIYGDNYEEVFKEVKKDLNSIKLLKYTHRPLNTSSNKGLVSESSDDFTSMLESIPAPAWFKSEGDGFNGKLMYIYTSGTTGLPKAAVISSARLVFMASTIFYTGCLSSEDIYYSPLPLYHSSGGCVTVGQALVFGCTVALRKKFSASSYFKDCIKYNATVAQYIGEMCRYVLATPPSPHDTQHKIRVVFGNGMRRVVWPKFVKRFNIKRVVEFYGATEGNANVVNTDNTMGAVGFISRINPEIYPIALLKVNQETGEPIRNSTGLCQLAKPNEPGLLIGKINPKLASRSYLGYIDKEATEKKIIRDVFEYGDSAFATGDILVADELGYLYFHDRTGDTFRWRGENVSTTEVEAVILRATQRDVVVYGVEIPNTEGRAGMCGIVDLDDSLDLSKFLKDISKDLPKYARPIFIRKMTSLQNNMTGTCKMRKMDLQKEGYDPNKVSDKIYYLDPILDKYLPLGSEVYEKIVKGQVRA